MRIDVPDDSEGNSDVELPAYRWAIADNYESDEAAMEELVKSFESLASSPDSKALGRYGLRESGSRRLTAGPLSIGWSTRSLTTGWLSLGDANGAAFFMYTDQPESLKDLQLSPLRWRPNYWISGPDYHGGWDHYLVPEELITEWEESNAKE